MPSFKTRSYKKELLDRDDIPFVDIKRNMLELDFINRCLGGHRITVKGVQTLLPQSLPDKPPLSIIEIGCGGGDNLRAIKKWADTKKCAVKLTGIDINEECIAYARSQVGNNDIQFLHSDYRLANMSEKPAIIFSSLFCHHFTDDELISQLKWMKQHASAGFFINDLHRHPLAYYAIKCLTTCFSKSYLVKNDAPLSVQRSFKKEDWQQAFQRAGIAHFSCTWCWAFRWLVTCHTNAG